MQRLDGELDGLHAALAEDDRLIPPSTLRQFFERVKAGDEELLLSILKFYYYAGSLGPDEMDKVDFLLTRLGTAKDADGEIVLKPAADLEKLSAALLSLTARPPIAPSEVQSVITLLDLLRRDLDACERFEDLTRKKTLENLRTLQASPRRRVLLGRGHGGRPRVERGVQEEVPASLQGRGAAHPHGFA